MPSRVAAALAALLLTGGLAGCMAGCMAGAEPGQLSAQVVDPPFEVAALPLTDTDGEPFSLTRDTDHRLTLVFFGYTHCPDICGIVMSNLASAMTRLDDADREQVQTVFVTTDPARDDEGVLRTYLDSYDPSFVGLTGDLDDIVEVGRSVAVGVSDGERLPTGGYDLNTHSTQVTAVDSDDEAPLYWSQETSSAQFAADIHTLLGRPD